MLVQNFYGFLNALSCPAIHSALLEFIELMVSKIGHQYCSKWVLVEFHGDFLEKLHFPAYNFLLLLSALLGLFVSFLSLAAVEYAEENLGRPILSQQCKLQKEEC